MATSHPFTSYSMQIVGASGTSGGGQPLIGATVQLKRGAYVYDGVEVVDDSATGSGIYSFTSVLAGNYILWINGSSTGQTIPVGAGELEKLGFDDDKIIVSDGTNGSFLYKTYTQLKTLLGLGNVVNVSIPDPAGQADGKVISVEGGMYVLKPFDLSVSASQVAFTPTASIAATNAQAAIEETYSESARASHTHDDRYYTETEIDEMFTDWETCLGNSNAAETGSFMNVTVNVDAGAYVDYVERFEIAIVGSTSTDKNDLLDVLFRYKNQNGTVTYSCEILGNGNTERTVPLYYVLSGNHVYFYIDKPEYARVLVRKKITNENTVQGFFVYSAISTATTTTKYLASRRNQPTIIARKTSASDYTITYQKTVIVGTAGGTLYMPDSYKRIGNRRVEIINKSGSDQTVSGNAAKVVFSDGTETGAYTFTLTTKYYVEMLWDQTNGKWEIIDSGINSL